MCDGRGEGQDSDRKPSEFAPIASYSLTGNYHPLTCWISSTSTSTSNHGLSSVRISILGSHLP